MTLSPTFRTDDSARDLQADAAHHEQQAVIAELVTATRGLLHLIENVPTEAFRNGVEAWGSDEGVIWLRDAVRTAEAAIEHAESEATP